MQRLGQRVLATGVGLVAMGAAAAPAMAASDPVLAAIQQQSKALSSSSAQKGVANVGKVKTPAQARADVPRFKVLVTKLEHAAVVVSRAKATTSQQREARVDWVRGDRDLAKSYRQLEAALTDIANGNQAAAKTAADQAKKPAIAGLKLELKAAKLLGQLKSGGGA